MPAGDRALPGDGHCGSYGYGKSTAVRWWRERYTARHPDALILWQTLTGSSPDFFWRGFCRVLRQLPALSESMANLGFPEDRESALLMAELLEDVLGEESRPIVYILDDIHYANTAAVSELLSLLLDRLPGQVRLILLSRNRILGEVDRFRLGGRLCQITMEDLRLRRDEILEYASACGLPLSPEQAETLDQISEGWISFLYLLFRSYIQYGRLQFQTPDIFRLMDQVMFQPLDGRKKRFLLLNGMTDDFTREQAAYLWEEPDGGALLDELTQDNGFITCDGESRVYRFHNMLRNVVRSHFRELSETEQKRLSARLGRWHMKQGEYVQAAETFYEAGEWEELLKALVRDRSKSFGGEYEPLLTKWSAQCPKELLLRCPESLLILMLSFYSYHNIPEMMRIYGLFQQSMEQNREMDNQERRNLLGETEIMLSFLAYNDIAAMSAHHRRACELMNRPSSTMSPESPWTFGAPSVLMAYHRTAGDMEGETGKMRECIPYYSRVTEGHGAGAEYVMEGEMLLMRGEAAGAETAYHKAVRESARAGQFSILAAAAFLSSRLGLLNGKRGEVFDPLENMEEPLREHRQYTLLPTLDMCRGWIRALLGSPEEAPDWLMRENAASRVLMPAIPMFQIIVNQLLLARGLYSQAAARWEELHGLCGQYHSLLCEVYLEL